MNATLLGYAAFLDRKHVVDPATGFDDAIDLPGFLFPHQSDIVRWALRRGRAGIFAGTGLGKTNMELVWASVVARRKSGPALIVAPLAVAAQHVREARKFGLDAHLASSDADLVDGAVAVTNYGKLDRFDLSRLVAIVLDESSILKSHDGKTRARLIEDCRSIPFRLAATATPAPNDFMELGNHSEFLGVMSYPEMLAMFFVHDGGETQKWRLKRHAETAFWQWMTSWSVMLRKPSDLGYSDDGYELPPLVVRQHTVPAGLDETFAGGTLFPMEARTMQERLRARRDTVEARAALAAALIAEKPNDPWSVWCNINAEAEAITALVPGAVEVRGSDREDVKERKLIGFAEGSIRVLVTKPTIAGYGCNWQHCADTAFVGLNDSFEQIFQALRRHWRFGQTRPVSAHLIASELEGAVVANLARKESDADRMAAAMVACMSDLSAAIVHGATRERADYLPGPVPLPHFLGVR